MKDWIKNRIGERTSWDGAVCVALGLMILFMAPLAKIAAGLAIAWGIWTIWKAEQMQPERQCKKCKCDCHCEEVNCPTCPNDVCTTCECA